MRLGLNSLSTLLRTNVVELRFSRRLKKEGYKDYRRMLCTNDTGLLQSTPGKITFHYTPPTQSLKYDPRSKNLINTFDIFMQNWRMINCDDVDVIAIIKTYPDPSEFWKYFHQKLAQMSSTHKARFMNT